MAGETLHHVDGVVCASLFAVIDDVETALHLFGHDVLDCLANGLLQFATAHTWVLVLSEQKLHDFRRARQAAGVGGQDAIHVRTRASPR